MSHNPSVTWIDQLDTSFPTGLEGALTDQYKCGPHQWSLPMPRQEFQHSYLCRNHTPWKKVDILLFLLTNNSHKEHCKLRNNTGFLHTLHRLFPAKLAKIQLDLWSGQKWVCHQLLVVCHQWWHPPIFQISRTKQLREKRKRKGFMHCLMEPAFRYLSLAMAEYQNKRLVIFQVILKQL